MPKSMRAYDDSGSRERSSALRQLTQPVRLPIAIAHGSMEALGLHHADADLLDTTVVAQS